MAKRNRQLFSIKNSLILKPREAALAAVEIYNNPLIQFKTETFIVLMMISWTYLLHAYYRNKGIEYRYIDKQKSSNKRSVFDKTNDGQYKYWGLEDCLHCSHCPLSTPCKQNLIFLIGIRHRIEHQMVPVIDEQISARLHACCLNYNKYIKELFDAKYAIEQYLTFALQFSKFNYEQKTLTEKYNLPSFLKSYIKEFDAKLPKEDYESSEFAIRYIFTPKIVNHKGQADRVIEFVPSNSTLSENVNKEYCIIKEIERKKFLPGQIVKMMQDKGFIKFNMHEFVKLWHSKDAKNPKYHYGGEVASKTWYWYSNWVQEVESFCKERSKKFK